MIETVTHGNNSTGLWLGMRILISFSSLVALFSNVFVLFWGKVLLCVTPAGREFTSPLPCLDRAGLRGICFLIIPAPHRALHYPSIPVPCSSVIYRPLIKSMPFYFKDCYFYRCETETIFSFHWILPQKHLWKDIWEVLVSCGSSRLCSQQPRCWAGRVLRLAWVTICLLGSSYL